MSEPASIIEKKFLTTNECAVFIGRTPGAVRNLVLAGKIPYRKPAGRLMFLRTEVESWIENAPGKRLEDFIEKI
jgi:hypothetical protein